MADHPLRPAIRRCLGEPLPHQLTDGTRTDLSVQVTLLSLQSPRRKQTYAVLAPVSQCYPPPKGTLSTRYSPVRHSPLPKKLLVRLACVRHAASVRSEPGSNSPVFSCYFVLNLHVSDETIRRRLIQFRPAILKHEGSGLCV